MSRYEKYKDSGIAWIGEIPEGWSVNRHKQVMRKIKHIKEVYEDENIISLSKKGVIIRDLDAGGKMPTSFNGYQKVYAGNLLLCLFDIDVTPRCVGLIKNNGLSSPAYSQFELSHRGYAPYYDYLLRYMDDEKTLLHLSKNLRSSLTEDDFSQINTIVPTIAEQKSIAEFLNKKCGEIDELVSLQEKMIDELKSYKQSVITEAVTKGLDHKVPLRDSGIEWIGQMPEHWEVEKIKNRIKFNPSISLINIEAETIVSYMPMECLRNGVIAPKTNMYKNVSTYTPFANNDIVLAKVTPCFENGNIAIAKNLANEIGFGTSEIFVIRCNDNIEKEYLFYYLQSSYIKYLGISSMYGTGGLKRVNPIVLCNSCLLCPPLHEQQQIADYLDRKCEEIDKLIGLKQEKIKELKDYKKSTIFEYVTGKKRVTN